MIQSPPGSPRCGPRAFGILRGRVKLVFLQGLVHLLLGGRSPSGFRCCWLALGWVISAEARSRPRTAAEPAGISGIALVAVASLAYAAVAQ